MAGKSFAISVFLNGVNNLGPAVKSAQNQLNGFVRATSSMQERLNKVARPMMLFGAATTGALALGAKSFMDFEDSVTRTALLTGEIGNKFQGNFDRISAMSKRLSMVVGAMPKEVSESLNMMIQAGIDPTGVAFEKMSLRILQFARVTNMGAKEAIDRVLGITNAMGMTLKGTEGLKSIERTMNTMRQVSVATMVNMDDMTMAISRSAASAKLSGMSIEELSAFIGVFGDKLIRGGVAATRMNQILFSLGSQVPKASKALKKIGVDVFDASGQMRPMYQIISDINERLRNVPPEFKNQILSDIFTRRAAEGIKALDELMSRQPGRIKELMAEAQKNANLWKAFDRQMGTLKGQFDKLRAAVTVLGLEAMGPLVNDVLKPMVTWATKNALAMASWIKQNPTLAGNIMKVVAAVGALSLVGGGLLFTISGLIGAAGGLAFGVGLLHPKMWKAIGLLFQFGTGAGLASRRALFLRTVFMGAGGAILRFNLIVGSIAAGLWLAVKAAEALDRITGGQFTGKGKPKPKSAVLSDLEKRSKAGASLLMANLPGEKPKSKKELQKMVERQESLHYLKFASTAKPMSQLLPAPSLIVPKDTAPAKADITLKVQTDKGTKIKLGDISQTGNLGLGLVLLGGGTPAKSFN